MIAPQLTLYSAEDSDQSRGPSMTPSDSSSMNGICVKEALCLLVLACFSQSLLRFERFRRLHMVSAACLRGSFMESE